MPPLLALIVLLAALFPPTAAAAATATEHATSGRTARSLNPDDPNGAWAGYSDGVPAASRSVAAPGSVAGMDVSGHQGAVDWPKAWADGARFAYVKATEGTTFRNPHFAQQYDGSYEVGMVRGAYHFGLPDRSSGAEQAHFFVDHGGGWSPDGRTLPGALDIEYNPYGETCYGMAPDGISQWIADFSDTYQWRTGRFPTIYTTTNWWNTCTGGNPDFGPNNPLWLARHAAQMGPLPAGWDFQTIWQFSTKGVFPGDQNAFNGTIDQLNQFTY